ncbi:nucleolar protein [Fusarium piperis]|uniref:Nucleolar protein n=1 Tax=Fusarium piperis TaxID=1435070 RepID=A0A9W8WIF7_9HYPO|nr:nucleolar protein [Fusarium piperis]
MAPELRKRKSVSDVQKPNGAAKPVKAAKGKRKAAEDASPVSLKKQRSVKKVTVTEKPAEKPARKSKKSKPVEEVEVVEEEETTTLDIPDESSESEAEESSEVKAIVEELDSGDEDITEGDAVFKPGQDVGKIPEVSKEVQKAAEGADEDSGVIYIGRIPHGFYEHEMKQYFEQFGTILALRLSRNKKTGASKHYAFVKFAEATTAEIVAKTMDNYLLFGHILKCRVIPKEQVHDDLFKGANRRFKAVPWNKMAGYQLQKPLTEAGWTKKVTKEQSRRAKKAAKLKEIGYEFEAPEIKDVPPPAPKAIENGEEEVKAIEAAPAEKEEEPKVEEPKAEEPVEVAEPEPEPVVEEPEVKTKAKPAPKAKKAKGTKAKGRKAKA